MPWDETLEIGKIVNTHGLKGEVKVIPWCDDVSTFKTLSSVLTKNAELKIENVKFFKNTVIIKFCGIDSIEQAEKMRNEILYVKRSMLGELNNNSYYICDIIGLKVYENDICIGVIEDCFPTGSNDVYVVKGSTGKEMYLPAIKEVVREIDVAAGVVKVTVPPGLLD